ncbi:MAG: hypothetical protein WCI56_14265 [Hyphomicrobiales bacterium]
MRRNKIWRLVAVIVGAGVVFALGQGLDASYFVSIPLGVAAYLGVLLATGNLWEAEEPGK